MTQFVFGSGTLILKRTDVLNTPPALLGTLQDLTIDFDRKIEGLLGQYNVAVALGGAELKITGKAKFARLQSTQANNLFFGQTLTTPSMLEMAVAETDSVTAAAVTVANHTGFVEDLGVFTAAGVQLMPVTVTPVAGVSYIPGAAGAGAYSFATGDNGISYSIYYSYTETASGNQIALANQLQGSMPTFEVYAKESFNYLGTTKDLVLKLNACASSKLSLPFSNSKFSIAEFDFQAQADASNNWGTLSISE
jgi:hypothetical protein